MKKHLITSALVLVALPLVSGCYFQARGVVRPPQVVVTAHAPTPPRVVVTARAPTPPRVVVTSSSRTTARAETRPGARVEARASARVQPPATRGNGGTVRVEAPPPPAVPVPSNIIVLGATQPLADITYTVTAAPPAPPASAVTVNPGSRDGQIWIAGHYDWSGRTWIWRPGTWAEARINERYVPPTYDPDRNIYVRGHWRAVTDASGHTSVIGELPERPPRASDLLPRPPSMRGTVNVNFSASASASTR